MNETKGLLQLNLTLFDGGEGGGAPTGDTAQGLPDAGGGKRANPLAHVVYGKVSPDDGGPVTHAGKEQQNPQDAAEKPTSDPNAAPPPEADKAGDKTGGKRAAFEELIRGEYKDQFNARMQKIINQRFRETKNLQAQVDGARPILDMLAQKYGVSGGDLKKLAAAIEEDDAYYEKEALDRGVSVEQLKQMRRVERENAELRRSIQESRRREEADRVYAGWVKEGEALKEIYPAFHLETEVQDQRFTDLLRNNIDLRTAYEVVHRDEILGGAMQYTARQVSEKLVNDIKAKGSRPTENGVSAQSAAVVKSDVNALTRQDRDEIERRVMRGERIVF